MARNQQTAGAYDIRNVIGGLIGTYGVILTVMGIFDAGDNGTGDASANLWAGLAMLVFGVVFALWYFRRKRIPTWKVADIAAPSLALGHGFGRIGCFMAGCCYGRACETPWKVEFTSSYAHELTGIPLNEALHPVQLYESVLNFLNFFLLFFILRKKRFDGQIFSLYIVNYSLIRYFTELYRGDHPERTFLVKASSPYLSLSVPQLFCILGLVFGLVLAGILKKKQRA